MALAWYQSLLNALVPQDPTITRPYLWHNDLHDDNIFVDPQTPEKITSIIDWQASHVSPLFNHNPDPAFLDWDGLEPETLDLGLRPDFSGMSPEQVATALRDYSHQNLFIGWRKLTESKNPSLYRAVEFRKTPAYGLIFLAHRLFEYGEAHLQSLVVDLKHTWSDLPGVPEGTQFPFDFSEEDIERIKVDGDGAVMGTELVREVKESLGDLWPDKGLIDHHRYDECKAALNEIKEQVLARLAETDEERAEYEAYWPFD